MNLTSMHTGQFVIRPRLIKRRRMWLCVLSALVVLVPYAAFEVGRSVAGYSVTQSIATQWQLHQRLNESQQEARRLQRELASAQMASQIDRKATTELQKTLDEVQGSLQKQHEELAFYRGVVSPQVNTAVQPTVQRLDIVPGADARHYELRVVLIQAAQANAQAQGTLTLSVAGRQQGQPVQLSLKQLAPALNTDVLKFAYRYFQNLQQDIELPEDFEPLSVQVELRVNGRTGEPQHFAWTLTPAAAPPTAPATVPVAAAADT